MRGMLRRISHERIDAVSVRSNMRVRRRVRLLAVLVVMALLLGSLPSGTMHGASKYRTGQLGGQPTLVGQLYHDLSSTLASIGTWMASHIRGESRHAMVPYQPVAAYLTPAPPFAGEPTSLTVTNTTSAVVSLSWNAPSGGADHYLIERSQNISGPFLPVANVTGTTHNDNTVTNERAYLYRVRAVSSTGVVSLPSNMALGTAIAFEFQELDNQLIRAEHFHDIRMAINLVRPVANLTAFSWARGTLNGLTVMADDVNEMRTALNAALTALSIPVTAYEDPTLNVGANGTLIKAIHIEQLQLRSTRGSSTSSGPIDPDSSTARLDPFNETGGGDENPLSRNFNWNLPLVNLPGRAGMDLGLALSYNSLVWTKLGTNTIAFDRDKGFPGPGFRLGFPVIQPLYFNAEVGKDAYLLIEADGGRVELRHQGGTSTLYQAADSSYLLFDSSDLILRTAEGAQMTYALKGSEYKCTKLKDRNGNFISVTYTTEGQINAITDTVGRVLTFNYEDGWLTSITQVWKQTSANPVTHYWARFEYTDAPIDINFPNLAVLGPTDGFEIKTLSKVKLADDSHFDFSYTTWGQVWKVTSFAPDNSPLNYRSYNLPQDGALAHADCPRFTVRYDWARYWNGDTNGVAVAGEEAQTTFIVPTSDSWTMPSGGSPLNGVRAQVTTPDGTSHKIFYFGAAGTNTGWQRGLPTLVDTFNGGPQPVKRAMTTWTQDNTSSLFPINPRILDTSVYNAAGNRSRTRVNYQQFTIANNLSCSLPTDMYEYGDGSTIIRTTRTDYNLDEIYTSRRIIGLIRQKRVYEGDPDNNGVLLSKVEMFYDESSAIEGNDTPVQHDNDDYSSAFNAGRGNVSSVKRHNVDTPSESTTTTTRYNTAGSAVSLKDALDHQITMVYADSFSDGLPRGTFAYVTTLNDPDNYSSTWKYDFDFGRMTRRQTPQPNVVSNTAGPEQSYDYDDIGRLERITNVTNNSYRRFVYADNQTTSDTFANIQSGMPEFRTINVFDGAGRNIGTASTFPGSSGGFSGQRFEYDLMGRNNKTSNPTDTSAIGLPWQWAATGDAWSFVHQTYDWKGRLLVTTNADGTTKEATYSGCGCAGGEVITIKDEGTMVSGVLRRRKEKLYTDPLGRIIKTEVFKFDETTVDSTYVNVYDALDRLRAERHYKDTAPANAELLSTSCPTGTCLQTTSTYDGYGRLKTRHRPEQQVDPTNPASTDHTTFDYRDDDMVEKVTDARGAVINYSYNARHLVTGLTYTTLPGVPTSGASAIHATPAATFSYDAVGNRTRMIDGQGQVDYGYDQLSRCTSETRLFNVSGRSYTFTYAYNLVNDLMSVTDSLGAQISYTRDEAAQLLTVTGTGTEVPTYASSFSYRAWGDVKHITYGNNTNYDVAFNQRMKPTSVVFSGADPAVPPFGPATFMNSTIQYFDDGRVKGASDLIDNKFDRAYSYDHVGRLENSFSNQQARDVLAGQTPSGTDQGPYRETLSYDFHGNMTQRVARFWSQPQETVNFTYSGGTNRLVDSSMQHDAEGNVVFAEGQFFKFDVAGQLARVGIEHEWLLRDGDGRVVVRVTRDGSGQDFRRKYDVFSSVIGQKLIEDSRTTIWIFTTLISDGWFLTRFMYGDRGLLIARETKTTFPSGNFSPHTIWAHQNPLTGSMRTSDKFRGAGMELPAELDSSGIDVGFEDPAANQPPPDDGGSPAVRDFELGQRCSLNGIPFDCSTPLLNKGGTFVVCPDNECSGARWNPNVEVANGLFGAWEFFHVVGNGFSGWMTPYGFAHYKEGRDHFYNSRYEHFRERKTLLSRTNDLSNHSLNIGQGPTPSQPAQPACNVQIPEDTRSQVMVGIALTESTQAEYKNGVLQFSQFTKDKADNSMIVFQGQQAEDELANEIYYIASAMINQIAAGKYKTLHGMAMAESVGYANDYDKKIGKVSRLNQLAYPVYCLKARLMLEKLAYIDRNGAAKDENENPIMYFRGVDQGSKRTFRKGDVRAANTDFMHIPPEIGGKPNKVYYALPYWKNGQWNEVKKKKKK